MRIFNFILTLMFVVFAFLQVNDPDPIIWISIYGSMAIVCVMAAFEFYLPKLLMVMGIVFLGYSFVYLPGLREWLQHEDTAMLFDNLAKMEFRYIEEAREYLGLMICLGVLGMHLYRSRARK
jgi:Transmembrane family 220, helix